MKWIGQHIYDLISRFRSDVYLEDIADGTVVGNKFLGLDSSNKIVKEAASATVTDLHSAGVDGNANQLLTDDGDGTITSEPLFLYDGVSSELNLTSLSDNKPSIKLVSLNASSGGPNISFLNNVVGEDDDVVGNIKFMALNDNSQSIAFANIQGEIETAADGEEGGKLLLQVSSHQGLLATGLSIVDGSASGELDVTVGAGAASVTTIAGDLDIDGDNMTTAGAMTLTTGGAYEIATSSGDITLDSAGDIALEAGGNDVTIDAQIVTFESSASLAPYLQMKSTGDTGLGSYFVFEKNAGSAPTDGDDIGTILWRGDDSGQTLTTYASMLGEISETDNTDEAGKLTLTVANNGGLLNGITMEGDKATAGAVDVTIAAGAASLTTIAGNLALSGDTITSAADLNVVATGNDILVDTDNFTILSAGSVKPHFVLRTSVDSNKPSALSFLKARDSANGADGDFIGDTYYRAGNDAQSPKDFAHTRGSIRLAADGAEEGQYQINVKTTEHASELQNGLLIASNGAYTDSTLGAGAGSTTTIVGGLVVTTGRSVNVASEAKAPIGMQIARRTITTAEANAMNSAPIELVPAQGADTIIEVIRAVARIDRAATQVNSAADMNLHYAGKEPGAYGAASLAHFRRFAHNKTTDTVERRTAVEATSGVTLTEDVNAAVEVSFDSATTTNCFTSIDIYVTYFVIDIS